MPDLSRVSIGIKTFLRDDKLFNTIQAIRDTMPEVTMIIADCGEHSDEKDGVYADLIKDGHKVIWLDFDAGFGAMSNAIADALDTSYLLIGSDDFDFRPSSVRVGIEDLVTVLDNTDIDVASGRVRGAYEFYLEDLGDIIIEHRLPPGILEDVWYVDCDLTVNFSLFKRYVFDKVRWDSEVKINGGEHGSQFVDLKRNGFKVAWVPTVRITEQEGEDSSRYLQYRSRGGKERPCFEKRGIRKYVLGNGKIDYEKKEVTDYPEPITR
jgi:hypothetical protein